MKKNLFVIVFLVLLLVGCSSGNGKLTVAVENEPKFTEGQQEEIVIRVEQDGKAVSDLEIDATLEMQKMDHGILEVHFTEGESGIYSTDVDLPMAGEWIMNVTADQDGEKFQTVVTFEVK